MSYLSSKAKKSFAQVDVNSNFEIVADTLELLMAELRDFEDHRTSTHVQELICCVFIHHLVSIRGSLFNKNRKAIYAID